MGISQVQNRPYNLKYSFSLSILFSKKINVMSQYPHLYGSPTILEIDTEEYNEIRHQVLGIDINYSVYFVVQFYVIFPFLLVTYDFRF